MASGLKAAPGDPSSARAEAQLCHVVARQTLGKDLFVLAAEKQVVGQKKKQTHPSLQLTA